MLEYRRILLWSVAAALLIFTGYILGGWMYRGVQRYMAEQPYPAVEKGVAPAETASVGEGYESAGRKVIYSAFLSLRVASVDEAMASIKSRAESMGGYLESMSSSVGGYKTGVITVRVPVDQFYQFIEWCKELGTLENEEVNGYDVTMEYTDLEARLNSLKATEQRYLEILAQARTVDEILQVERELSRIRSEIESLEGRLRYLEHHVEMATVTVNLREEKPARPIPIMPEVDWREILARSLSALVRVAAGLIVLAFALIPLAAVAAPAYILIKRRRKSQKQRSREPGAAGSSPAGS